jgi:uncharacterized protein YndB with AHSA1/START domain
MPATTPAVTDRIEKEIVLKAPRARVWRALTDPVEFGRWFGVEMRDAFAPGARAQGRITHPGYEHLTLDMTVERMEPERLFSWRWHPHAVDAARDYSGEPTTLVECELTEVPGGTRLRIVESGFDRVPLARRTEAFRMNFDGWSQQAQRIARYLDQGK